MARVPSTTEYNSGLPSPFPSTNGDTRSEASPQDQSAAHPYSHSEHRAYISISATPTSDNGGYPHSARSATSYVDPYHREQLSVQGSNMASHSSSLNLQDEADAAHPEPQEDAQQLKSDPDLPIDPSIAQSPTQYAYTQSLYGHEHQQYHNPQAVYHPTRPDWAGYNGHTPITPNHHNVFHQSTTPTGRPGNQVFSFVPIPGSQQHKRPRRRYEEIERMYKCGWQGCEKAYGTLNHLNAHVTMQSHGNKRIPEEFKEIRKEWKARKKAEEATRKQQDDQARADGQATTPGDTHSSHDTQQYTTSAASRNLPAPSAALGYNPATYPNAPTFSSGADYNTAGYPTANAGHSYAQQSPSYVPSHTNVYGQANGGQPH